MSETREVAMGDLGDFDPTDRRLHEGPQCQSMYEYGGEVYYCLRARGHPGTHWNPTVPDEAEQVWATKHEFRPEWQQAGSDGE